MAINFPSNPTNGQIHYDTNSGNRYFFDSVAGRWVYAANNDPFPITANTEVLFNNNGGLDGNPGLTFDPTSNTLTANTINAYSMRVTGNLYVGSNTVTITNDAVFAQTFYIMDNGDPVAVSTGSKSNAVYDLTNSSYTHANASFNHSNLTYAAVNSAFDLINTAFTQSNTDNVRLTSAYTYTNLSYSIANAAFDKANAALANISGVYFNGNLFFPSGNLGIGSTTSNAKLFIQSSSSIAGIRAYSDQATAIIGQSIDAVGVTAFSESFNGIETTSNGSGYGIIGSSRSGVGVYAGSISGRPLVVGKFAGPDYLTVNNAGVVTITSANLTVSGQNVLSIIYTGDAASNSYTNVVGSSANNYAGAMANSGNVYTSTVYAAVNSAFGVINAAYTSSNADFTLTNAVFTQSNTDNVRLSAAYVSANANYVVTNAAFGVANSALAAANQAGVVANNANTFANSTYVKKAGDTITGDLVVQGNLTTSGVVTYANTQTLLIGDNIITLNADLPAAVAPSEDSGIEIRRGSSANVSLLWNEGSDRWTFTNDGTNYRLIASNTDVESANNYAGAMANAANAYATSINDANLVVARAYTNTSTAAANNYAGAMANSGNVFAGLVYTAVNSAFGVINAAFGTANSKVASVTGTSGRITSSGGTTPAIDLATAGAGAASYSSGISALTVDAYGRVTSVTGSAGYITSSGSITGSAGSISGLNNPPTNNGGTWPHLVKVNGDGAVEIGRYLDFHNGSADGIDYSVRLETGGTTTGLTLNGSQVITAGNYSSYSLPLSGGTMTGALNIGTATNLSFGNATRQMINLWSTSYGIGVQSGTTYFRTGSRFSWHRGGVHSDAENDPGAGGTSAMTLDSSSNLTAVGSMRSPIFYDSNNTAFYVDPTSTSVFAGQIQSRSGATASFYVVDAAGASSYNYIMGAANDTGNKLVMFVNGSSRTADGGVNTVTIRNDGGPLNLGNISTLTTLNGSSVYSPRNIYFDANSGYGINLNGTSTDMHRIYLDGFWTIFKSHSNEGWQFRDNGNNIRARIYGNSGRIDAPSLYDSDNTGFYVDPNSVSRMSITNIDYLRGSRTINSSYNSSNTLLETPTGIEIDSGRFIRFTGGLAPFSLYRTSGDQPAPYGIGWGNGGESSGIFQRLASNGSSFGEMIFYTGNDGSGSFAFRRGTWEGTSFQPSGSNHYGTLLASIDYGGVFTATGDVRSPIFYDSNDTGYYVNPNGSSTLWTLLHNGGTAFFRGGQGVDQCCGGDGAVSIGGNSTKPPRITWHSAGIMEGVIEGNATGWRKIYFFDNQGNGLGVHATGQIASNSNVIAYYSDRRLKEDFDRVTDHWNVINNINGYRFTWNERAAEIPGFVQNVGKREVGLVAQEVLEVYPEAVYTRTEGPEDDPYKTILHDRFSPIFIEALKDLHRKIQELEAEIKELKNGK